MTSILDSLHAEIMAIRKACKKLKTQNLSGCTLYSNVEPCFMCFTCAAWAGISRIVYPKSRDECPKSWYHTQTFDIQKLNKFFRKKIKTEKVNLH